MNTIHEPKPDHRIEGYVNELAAWTKYSPGVNRTHVTLHYLNCAHGEYVVRTLLNQYWAAQREYAVAIKREFAANRVEQAH